LNTTVFEYDEQTCCLCGCCYSYFCALLDQTNAKQIAVGLSHSSAVYVYVVVM